jgi:hypothetical protein
MEQQVLLDKLGELSPEQKSKSNLDIDQLAQHLPKPMNGLMMETLRIMVEMEN